MAVTKLKMNVSQISVKLFLFWGAFHKGEVVNPDFNARSELPLNREK